jgi:PAS domain S-box-containing protein
MIGFLHRVFSSDEFMPHGMCYVWNPTVIWLNVISDGLIALAYYSIPLTLLYFVRKRRDLQFSWIFVCFAIFIIACGTTHLMEILNIWHPVYWLAGGIKAVTAAVSLLTAVLLVRLVPAALALPSPAAMQQAIHELRASEEETARGRARLALATQVLQAGIWEWNLQTHALVWNEAMYRIYGRPQGEPLDEQVWTRTVLPEDLPGLEAELRRLIETKSQGSTEFRILLPDGSVRHLEAAGGVVLDEAGQVVRIVGVNIDVTDRRQLDRRLLHLQRMESIGTMATGIAHDLNNILTPILMSIGLLKAAAPQAAAQGILDTIEISAKRGAEIVRQVLSFAQGVESARIEVPPARVLLELKTMIQDTFPKNLRIQFSVPDDLWSILADPTQFYQVLMNLCVNARDAMPDGGDLTIRAENCVLPEQTGAMGLRARAGRYLAITVTDTGTGMPAPILERIFEPFFTTKVLTKGTGLGLSTVYTIVKSHAGLITVFSRPGHGTTFRVHLPATADRPPADPAPLPVDLPLQGRNELILLIDDEASIREITEQALQGSGYRVVTAANGAEGLTVYSQRGEEIALVIADMNMPVMDGRATINALLRINPMLRIIGVSGLRETSELITGTRHQVRHFLPKPYSMEALLTTIRSTLDAA